MSARLASNAASSVGPNRAKKGSGNTEINGALVVKAWT
jgi:hypothetical protein